MSLKKSKNKKKLKKELFLNYTVMLLPHSQDKPIHFKIPVWVFLGTFVSMFALLCLTMFFSYSSYHLKNVADQKRVLEAELSQMEVEKARLAEEKRRLTNENIMIARENEILAENQDEQAQELEKLKNLSEQTQKDLEALFERENDMRDQLGIDEAEPRTQEEPVTGDSSSADQDGVRPAYFPARSQRVPTVGAYALSPASVQGVEEELRSLQKQIQQQDESYDTIATEIDKKEEQKKRDQLRSRVVSYALQFVGNAYVYGGRDPHTGVDCSGFSSYVLGNVAGVSLNRTASAQSQQGRSVTIENARPGDLIFYESGGHVNHVAIYIGNGQVVHASNERTGIIVSNWNYRTPAAIKNMID